MACGNIIIIIIKVAYGLMGYFVLNKSSKVGRRLALIEVIIKLGLNVWFENFKSLKDCLTF